MQPVSCSVEWYEKYANSARLEIGVDSIPDSNRLRYEQKGVLYFAELEGYVSFYSYTAPGDGYAGRAFPITMKDGTEKTLKGPWSSRAGVMSPVFRPVLDVVLQPEDNPYPNIRYGGHVALEFALEAIKLCEESIELVVEWEYGEYIFVPQRKTIQLKEN